MKPDTSRRKFLAAGLAAPAAGVAASRLNSPVFSAAPSLAPGAQGDIELRYGTLGKTGLKITKVSMGCMITSDQSVVERAADLGVIYFDTARVYQQGNNERMVGAALGDKRKNLVVASKTQARDSKAFFEHLETSLSTFGTDYFDIWYLHSRNSMDDINDELFEAMEQAKKQGKVRFGGVSTHGGGSMVSALARNDNVDVILTTYNASMREDQAMSAALAEAHQAGKGVVAMKVMTGAFGRGRGSRGGPPPEPKSEAAMAAMLKWVLNNPNVDTAIPSMTDMEQLDQNLRAMTSSFTAEDEKLLAAQLEFVRPLYCHYCGACAGACPKGLPVSDIIRHLSYAEGYGQFQLARESFLELPSQIRDVRCADCSECAVKCPNGVHIVERLTRAQELLA